MFRLARRPILRTLGAIGSIAGLATLVAPATPAAAAPTSAEQQLLDRLARARANHGLRQYRIGGAITAVAREQARRMADTGTLHHNPRLTTDVTGWRHRAGCMLFHPKHDHWHFKASAQYSLVDPRNGDAVVSYRRKVSFCLRDTARVPAEYGTWTYREVYGACTKRSPQGISVGWMDIYQSFLAGQRLVLPDGLADGLYCLQTVVDPVNQLVEGNDLNNSSVAAFRIRGETVHLRAPERCL